MHAWKSSCIRRRKCGARANIISSLVLHNSASPRGRRCQYIDYTNHEKNDELLIVNGTFTTPHTRLMQKVSYSTGQRYWAQNACVKCACMSNTHRSASLTCAQSKVISIYELPNCSPILVILLLVFMAVCHHVSPGTALMLSYSS